MHGRNQDCAGTAPMTPVSAIATPAPRGTVFTTPAAPPPLPAPEANTAAQAMGCR
jgi:hypothetical protein